MSPVALSRGRSFRFRIALFSVLVSGGVLAFFAGLAFAAVQRINEQRIDEDISRFGHRNLMDFPAPGHWDRVVSFLRYSQGQARQNEFILLVKDGQGRVEYVSSNWPEELPLADFALPEGAARPEEVSHRPDRREGLPPFPEPFRDTPPHERLAAPPEFLTRTAGETQWRIGRMATHERLIVFGLNMARMNAEMKQVGHALVMALAAALLLVALGAWWVSHRALAPIEGITGTIKRVKAKGLAERISSQDEDREFSELIAVFNDMMDWVERGFHQAIRFSADASHELKTPLTVLQAHLEQAVHEAEPGSDEQRRYESLAQELQRLKSIAQKLLLLSRIDAGELKLHLPPLNLSELIEAIAEDTEILAPKLTITADIASNLWVRADPDLIKQVVQNLASNATQYNRDGGFVNLSLQAVGEQVHFTIANSGRAIPPEDHEKIFTRFYRSDKARSRDMGGAGLGLSLAGEIARAHHGELVLESSSEERTVFSLRLPKHAPATESGPGDEQ